MSKDHLRKLLTAQAATKAIREGDAVAWHGEPATVLGIDKPSDTASVTLASGGVRVTALSGLKPRRQGREGNR